MNEAFDESNLSIIMVKMLRNHLEKDRVGFVIYTYLAIKSATESRSTT